ncbi:MAG: hypothetical protein AAF206_01375 [Bacteroidota bacterium]
MHKLFSLLFLLSLFACHSRSSSPVSRPWESKRLAVLDSLQTADPWLSYAAGALTDSAFWQAFMRVGFTSKDLTELVHHRDWHGKHLIWIYSHEFLHPTFLHLISQKIRTHCHRYAMGQQGTPRPT